MPDLPPNRKPASSREPLNTVAVAQVDPVAAALKLDQAKRAVLVRELLKGLPPGERGRVLSEFEPVPSRSKTTANGEFVYVIKVEQKGSGLSMLIMLVHDEAFKKDRLEEMVMEAAGITVESSIGNMRKNMAEQKTAIQPDQIVAFNERAFETQHSTFFEAAMCDKYNFRKLHVSAARCEIEPTILVSV